MDKSSLRRDLEEICPLRARAVMDELERGGPLAAALSCLKAAEDDLRFFRRHGCLPVWPETLQCLYFARRLLEEELKRGDFAERNYLNSPRP